METPYHCHTLMSLDRHGPRIGVNQGRSKPELENLEPRTQDLARFWNSVLFQAEPTKMMWQCDEIVTFVPSSRKIVTFLEVLKKTVSKPGSVTSNLECDEMWRKCDENVTKMWRHIISSPSLTRTQGQVLGKFRNDPSNRKIWRLEKIGDSGTNPVILKYYRCTTYCKHLATAGKITQQES